MDKIFKLKESGTSVRTEIVAGLTTFMTMAYIIALNPNLLTGWRAGGDDLWNAVFLATCLASGSIGHAIGIGLISFTVINICTGKASRHFILTYILALVFLVKFFLVA